ncbi:MAG: RnfABCDGE type electron transport complex subunit D [Gemmatimonadota bacterium]|nr:RnfABCDGE type electron transport complex subunit D [Gemmatimonadota bacterium]
MPASRARRYLRSPKGLLIICFALLLALAAAAEGVPLVAPGVLAATLAAVAIDVPLLRWRAGRWMLPDGALLTGLIVAMVLSPHEPAWTAAVTSAIAIVSKYVLRAARANVFNPAALALVITFYLFDTGHSWWGALSEAPPWQIVALFATGMLVTDRVRKSASVLAFLGVYFALVTGAAFAGDPARVAELYRIPNLNAALYFAFFMVTDPPTSPGRPRDQLVYGTITAVVAFAAFELIGAVWFLLAGVLAANVNEAWRRTRSRRVRVELVEAARRAIGAEPAD